MTQELETWTAYRQDDEDGTIYWAIHSSRGYEFITNVYDSESRAQLIAAAPKLLAALTDIEAWLCAFDPDNRKSRQAGRTALIKARAALTAAKATP